MLQPILLLEFRWYLSTLKRLSLKRGRFFFESIDVLAPCFISFLIDSMEIESRFGRLFFRSAIIVYLY